MAVTCRAAKIRSRAARSAAAVAAIAMLGGALLLAACNSPDAAAPSASTPSPVTSPSPAGAPAPAPPTLTPTPDAGAPPTAATASSEAPSATVAAPTPQPSATPTAASGGPGAAAADPKPTQSLARDDGAGSEPDTKAGGSQRREGTSKGEADSGAPTGTVYTWQDGDRTERVYLASDLTVQANADTTDDDEVVVRGASESIVRSPPGGEGATTSKPVFRSQGGALMTLPGGVLLVLDDAWDPARVKRFFADNGISTGDVEERDWAVNAFFIRTAPGFASLNLANALAPLEGVEISSPNWQTQVTTR